MAAPVAKKILIVEDHKDMMAILVKYLQDHHFKTVEAETAEIGLELFEQDKPDLVLMDLMLPGMSGLEAISHIKKSQENNSYTPVIVLTAKSDVKDIITGLDSGADDYVVKPFNFEELVARIRTSLRLKELNEILSDQALLLEGANTQINKLNQSLVGKNKELRRNIYNLHSLFEISMELTSILQLSRLVNSILLTFVGQYSCKSALFLLAQKPDINRLETLNIKGFNEQETMHLKIFKSDPLIEYLHTTHTPVQTNTLQKKIKKSKALESLKSLGIQLISPTLVRGKVEGLICLGPRVKDKKYQEQELENISILNNIISIAVTNALLYEEVEQLSYTDGMTDLHNFRYFELRLREEIVRHKRTKNGLSLLILDVDKFKNYNDTMGHPAGDEVLRKLSKILKETIRENDIAARYGGEEFAVILPDVHKEGAQVLAERIRENVEKTYFDHEEVQPSGKITVSIGVASLPEDANEYKELVNCADNALYEAKNSGRNRVLVYPDAT